MVVALISIQELNLLIIGGKKRSDEFRKGAFHKLMIQFHRKYFENGVAFPQSYQRNRRPTTLSKDKTSFHFNHGKVFGAGCTALQNSFKRKGKVQFEIKAVNLKLGLNHKPTFEIENPARYCFASEKTITENQIQFYDLELCETTFTVVNDEIWFQTPLKISEMLKGPYPVGMKTVEPKEKWEGKSKRKRLAEKDDEKNDDSSTSADDIQFGSMYLYDSYNRLLSLINNNRVHPVEIGCSSPYPSDEASRDPLQSREQGSVGHA